MSRRGYLPKKKFALHLVICVRCYYCWRYCAVAFHWCASEASTQQEKRDTAFSDLRALLLSTVLNLVVLIFPMRPYPILPIPT